MFSALSSRKFESTTNYLDSGKYEYEFFYRMPAGDKEALARRAEALRGLHKTVSHRIFAAFFQCEAGVQPEKNIADVLKAADDGPEAAFSALSVIAHISCSKSEALPLVLSYLRKDIKTLPEKEAHCWHAAARCLRGFRDRESGPQLLEFLKTTQHPLLVQEAAAALEAIKDPAHFDAIRKMAANSPKDLVFNYLRVLSETDAEKTIPICRDVMARYPELTPDLILMRGNLGDRSVIPQAIQCYLTAEKEQYAGFGAYALGKVADPSIFGQVRFRPEAGQSANSHLLQIIADKGGDENAFSFAEQFYLERVQSAAKAGKPADPSSSWACIRAFSRLGNRKALPYLQEMLKTTDRKEGVAEAIGNIMLEKRLKARPDLEIAEVWERVNRLDDERTPPEIRRQAIAFLLARKSAALDCIVGRIKSRDMFRLSATEPARPQHLQSYAYLAEFGEDAARRLLEESSGCALVARCNLARLMSMLPAECRSQIRDAAVKGTDLDQRKTAIAALGFAGDKASEETLRGLAGDEELRMCVVEALAGTGGPHAR